jgi:hypothetical protein
VIGGLLLKASVKDGLGHFLHGTLSWIISVSVPASRMQSCAPSVRGEKQLEESAWKIMAVAAQIARQRDNETTAKQVWKPSREDP